MALEKFENVDNVRPKLTGLPPGQGKSRTYKHYGTYCLCVVPAIYFDGTA